MKADKATKNLTLLALARVLVDELRYINYPKEWSGKPLSVVLSSLIHVLNIHPAKLGDIVKIAFDNSIPITKAGNVNQLDRNYPELFGQSRQYYLDLYAIVQFKTTVPTLGVDLSSEISNIDTNDTEKRAIASLAQAIVQAFKSFSIDQLDEHRTLERVSFAVTPVCYSYGLVGIGFDLSEYADYWRTLSSQERQRLATVITSRWG